MATPGYTTDLVTIDTAEAIAAWAEPSETAWMLGGPPAQDADYPYIQGSYSVLQACTKTGIASMLCNSGGAITLPTDGAFLVWQNFYSPGPIVLESYANGGMRVMVGSSLGAFDSWDVGGTDTGRNPYGGWINHAVNPTVGYDDRVSTGAGNYQYVGAGVNIVNGIGKGYPHNVDVVRYGRCEAKFTGGEAANYAIITGFQALNDASAARWGLIQKIPYGFLWKGLISFGSSNVATVSRARATNVATIVTAAVHNLRVGDKVTVAGMSGTGYNATAAVVSVPTTTSFTYANTGSNEGTTGDTGGTVGCIVDYRDSNRLIFIEDTRKVTAAFNKVEVKHASSRVDLTGYSFICISPTTSASKGRFEVVDNADVNLDSCLFQDMDTLIFMAQSTILDTIFRRCGLITQGGAAFDGCLFSNSPAAVAMLCSNVGIPTNCEFVSTGTGHAIELNSSHAGNDYNLNNLIFTNYGADATANAAIKNNSGGHVNLTVLGGTEPTVLDVGASTTTVILPDYTLTVAGLELGAEVTIVTAGTTTVLSHTEAVSDGEGTGETIYILDLGVAVALQELESSVELQSLAITVEMEEIEVAVVIEEEDIGVEIKGGSV